MNWPPSLAVVSGVIGMGLMLSRLPGVIVPGAFREQALRFPRSVLWGRVLMFFVTILAGVNLYHAASDEWAWARPFVILAVPVAYWLVIQYGDSFLSVRAAGALLLFLAKLMVTAADRSDHPWRLVVTVLAYIWVVAGIWMAAAPHQVRDVLKILMANDRRCRIACAVSALLGAGLVLLGTFVY